MRDPNDPSNNSTSSPSPSSPLQNSRLEMSSSAQGSHMEKNFYRFRSTIQSVQTRVREDMARTTKDMIKAIKNNQSDRSTIIEISHFFNQGLNTKLLEIMLGNLEQTRLFTSSQDIGECFDFAFSRYVQEDKVANMLCEDLAKNALGALFIAYFKKPSLTPHLQSCLASLKARKSQILNAVFERSFINPNRLIGYLIEEHPKFFAQEVLCLNQGKGLSFDAVYSKIKESIGVVKSLLGCQMPEPSESKKISQLNDSRQKIDEKMQTLRSSLEKTSINLEKFYQKHSSPPTVQYTGEIAEVIFREIFLGFNEKEELTPFLLLFNRAFLKKILETALYFKQNPEQFTDKKGAFLSDEEAGFISQTTQNIITVVLSIKNALEWAMRQKGIEVHGFLKQGTAQEAAHCITYLQSLLDGKSDEKDLICGLKDHMPEILGAIEQCPTTEQTTPRLMPLPAVDSTISPLSNSSHSTSSPATILYSQDLKTQFRVVCCSTDKPESAAALWQRNPVVKAINDGLSLHYSFAQILKLYELQARDLNWLVLLDVVGGLIGARIGYKAVLSPNAPQSHWIRFWEATTDGVAAFVFTLDDAIHIHLATNKNGHISDKEFWKELAPVPLLAFLFYTAWRSMSPNMKERYFPQEPTLYPRWHWAGKFIDGLLSAAFYSRIFQFSLALIPGMPNELPYELIPCAPAALMAYLHHSSRYQKRYKERIELLATYMMALNFTYLFVRDTISTFHEKEDPMTSIFQDGRLIFWLLNLVLSIRFVFKHSVSFIHTYRDPELIVQYNPLPSDGSYVGMDELDEIVAQEPSAFSSNDASNAPNNADDSRLLSLPSDARTLMAYNRVRRASQSQSLSSQSVSLFQHDRP